jgi:hypothetical protein
VVDGVDGQPGVAENKPWSGFVVPDLVVGEAVEADATLARGAKDLAFVPK